MTASTPADGRADVCANYWEGPSRRLCQRLSGAGPTSVPTTKWGRADVCADYWVGCADYRVESCQLQGGLYRGTHDTYNALPAAHRTGATMGGWTGNA